MPPELMDSTAAVARLTESCIMAAPACPKFSKRLMFTICPSLKYALSRGHSIRCLRIPQCSVLCIMTFKGTMEALGGDRLSGSDDLAEKGWDDRCWSFWNGAGA